MVKTTIKILSLTLFSIIAISCSKSDNDVEATNNESYVKFDVTGIRANGNYRIEKTDNSGEVIDLCQYLPENTDEGINAKVALAYIDNNQTLGFSFIIPAKEGLVEIIKDNPNENEIDFSYDFGVLEASTISVNVTELELQEGSIVPLVTHIKGNFEGIAIYINFDEVDENGDAIIEPHTVNGNFEYNRQ